jgi:prenyltransferase beta subunit
VGEFLQCLKILQYHPSRDRDLIDLEERGLKYLLHLGEATSGKWSNDSQSFYDQYHSIYCATIGLLPYYYSEVCVFRGGSVDVAVDVV